MRECADLWLTIMFVQGSSGICPVSFGIAVQERHQHLESQTRIPAFNPASFSNMRSKICIGSIIKTFYASRNRWAVSHNTILLLHISKKTQSANTDGVYVGIRHMWPNILCGHNSNPVRSTDRKGQDQTASVVQYTIVHDDRWRIPAHVATSAGNDQDER